MGRLKGRSVVITGAASGIGRASALLCAREGARLVLMDRASDVENTGAMVRNEGGEAEVIIGDAGSEADVKALVDRAMLVYGAVDGVYANAGITGGPKPFFEQTAEDWAEVLRVNLIGPFLAIKHAAPLMVKAGKGSIVCTASVAGIRSGAGPAAYSASKAGVMNLVQTSCQILAGTGVRVNGICPGLIETGMTRPVFEMARAKGTIDRVGQLNPLKRGGVPEEIAAMALFLLSDESSYVNGQSIAVDGGLSSSHPIVVRRG